MTASTCLCASPHHTHTSYSRNTGFSKETEQEDYRANQRCRGRGLIIETKVHDKGQVEQALLKSSLLEAIDVKVCSLVSQKLGVGFPLKTLLQISPNLHPK